MVGEPRGREERHELIDGVDQSAAPSFGGWSELTQECLANPLVRLVESAVLFEHQAQLRKALDSAPCDWRVWQSV